MQTSSTFKVGDRLIYFGPYSQMNGQLAIVLDIIERSTTPYFIEFPNMKRADGTNEECSSAGRECVLEEVYNSPLYQALR